MAKIPDVLEVRNSSMEVTTTGVEVFGISSMQLDDIVIEGSLQTVEDLMNTLMAHPQMRSVMQQFILQRSISQLALDELMLGGGRWGENSLRTNKF